MDRAYLRMLSQPRLENPIFVAGLPCIGNIGVVAARLLAESTQAELFAELYSPVLPDYTIVDEDGLCSMLRYEFLTSTSESSLIILIGEVQPPAEDLLAYYELCGDILDFIENFNCNLIITLDGFPSLHSQREIYVAGNSNRIVSEYASLGAKPYSGGRIMGIPGLLLGLAKLRGMSGICLLSPAVELASDRDAAFNAYKFLRKILKFRFENKPNE